MGAFCKLSISKGKYCKTGGYYATEIALDKFIKIDATANFTWIQNKYAVIPEAAFTYYSTMYYIASFGRAEITPYTITPKVGLSFLTFIEVDLGYGLPIADKADYRPIKGFTTSIRFNIPINSKF
ncbi:MAG: hypothetical protein LBE34_02980 [Flavobacteriaceae bacterium]|jgi:hypothetical protein|nr:hypothetical protein [Flavobacteriaceae bacterium]